MDKFSSTRDIIRKLIEIGWIDELNDKTVELAARDLDKWLGLDEYHSMLLWGSE